MVCPENANPIDNVFRTNMPHPEVFMIISQNMQQQREMQGDEHQKNYEGWLIVICQKIGYWCW